MTTIERSIHIDASPEDVFAQLQTWDGLRRWSTITVDHTALRAAARSASASSRPSAWPASTCGPTGRSPTTTRRAASPTARPAPGDSHMRMRQHVTADGDGSRLELEVEYELPAGVLGQAVDRLYAQRRNEREAEHTLDNLKDLLENRR
jgi:hypothetical protein